MLWFRYIDDVFFIWTHGKEKLEEFLEDFNNYYPNIKFTHEFNKERITFMDLKVALSGDQWTTDQYIKSTDKHQYLRYASTHPYHTKRFFVLSQAFRVSRICSNKTYFEKHLQEMKSWFQAGDYPKYLIQKKMNNVWFNKQNKNTKKSKLKE